MRGLDWILGLLAPLVALAIFIVAVRRAGGNQGGAEPWQSAVLLLSCVFLVANPLSGPGSSIFSLTSGNGSDALYLVRTITTGDVAAWTAELPVTAGLDFPRLLVWLGAGLAVVAVAALAASRSSAARLLTLASGGSILAAGIMDVLYAMGRIPVAASRADLMARFADSILPRIDMAESVLDFGVSGQGPFAISIMEGMAVGLALAVAGSVLIISSLRRMKGPKRPVEGLTAALAALTVFAGMRALVLSQTAVPHPPAAAPFAMIAMLIAAFAAFIALLHPKWKSGVLAVATIAAAMQLALA